MASVTTNYGFDVPTSSDLVKNGATQIALLGQDLDTFLFRPFTRNTVINGGMDIWQRSTSQLDGNNTYVTADRWLCSQAPQVTFSRQATGDTTNLPFIQYCMRLQRTAGGTQTNGMNIAQSFETVNSIPLAGKTVTLSFYARKGANYSAAASNITAQLITGTGTDQNVYTVGYTGSVTAINQSAVLTTTWQRFTYSATLASNTTEIGLVFVGAPTGTAGAADYYEITGIQLEAGSQATPFTRQGGSIQGELAACQRYYYRAVSGAAYGQFGGNPAYTTGTVSPAISFPVVMRTVPTAVDTTGVGGFILENNSSISASAFTSIALNTSVTTSQLGVIDIVKSGAFTTGIYYKLIANNSTTAYIGFSSEL